MRYVVPIVRHDVSASGRDEGHSLTLERHNEDGRVSAFAFGEMTLGDLQAIRTALDHYLKEHRDGP